MIGTKQNVTLSSDFWKEGRRCGTLSRPDFSQQYCTQQSVTHKKTVLYERRTNHKSNFYILPGNWLMACAPSRSYRSYQVNRQPGLPFSLAAHPIGVSCYYRYDTRDADFVRDRQNSNVNPLQKESFSPTDSHYLRRATGLSSISLLCSRLAGGTQFPAAPLCIGYYQQDDSTLFNCGGLQLERITSTIVWLTQCLSSFIKIYNPCTTKRMMRERESKS